MGSVRVKECFCRCDQINQIKSSILVNPRCLHVQLTYPCWMSSFSFATFLSSITVRDKTKRRAPFYNIIPQDQLSPMTGSMQRLITSLVSPTTSSKNIQMHKHLLKRHTVHSNTCAALTYILRLFCGARRSRWDRTALERIFSALWSTLRRKDNKSHNTPVTSDPGGLRMLEKDNRRVT